MAQIMVRKGDSTLEPLDYNKITRALRRAGAKSSLAKEVIDSLESKMYDNMPTHEIYRLAFEELRKMKPGAAARFSLKSALLKLGPSGYPFETFVAALLKGRKYNTRLRQIVRGKCIQHEVDVIATRPVHKGHKATKSIIECKFHNSPHFKCHIQSALYSWARFLDIKDVNKGIDSAWLATNTKFSHDVVRYSDCVGLKLMGWSFPKHESIQVRIDENKLYPITLIHGLDRRTFSALHSAGIILVKELEKAPREDLKVLKIKDKRIDSLKQAAKRILSSKH